MQRFDVKLQPVFADRQYGDAEAEVDKAHHDARRRQPPNVPAIRSGGRADIVRGGRHREKIAGDHQHHHQHRRQDRVTRDREPGRKKQDLTNLVHDRSQRIGQDALKGYAAGHHGGADA